MQAILNSQSELEDGVVMNDADAFQEILGHRSGYVCGRGVGFKPTSSAVGSLQKEKDIERDRQVGGKEGR